jgi:hypothetical protein
MYIVMVILVLICKPAVAENSINSSRGKVVQEDTRKKRPATPLNPTTNNLED